ncbi:SDR family oxidoreductase [Allokutzneria sp. NRRL B-24872]|uniref:SDR family oxidoreductase n=1 Tax=Allokutzneria sp. NRRL B-24872 TaxID=1137961 RepID=UPI000A3BD08A|nr:SDR family oxidoreductase [Allokutzneria sp. NRRL B-24872]
MRELAGRSVVVLGGSTGTGATPIGAAVLDALREAGARVLLGDARPDERVGPGVRFARCELTDDAQVSACLRRAADELGGLDAVINLGASPAGQGAERFHWLDSLNSGVVSAAITARAAHRHLRGAGGAIVNLTSDGTARRSRWLAPVGKAALVELTRSIAADFAEDGIRVNSVSPAWTWSEVLDQFTGEAAEPGGTPFHPLGRVADPAEVAEVVLFLCSPSSAFITGSDWAVAGGYTSIGAVSGTGS